MFKERLIMKNLEQTRREIDRIDEGLVKLFLERLAVSRDVAMAKLETGGPVSDPAREREILTRVSEAAGPRTKTQRVFSSRRYSRFPRRGSAAFLKATLRLSARSRARLPRTQILSHRARSSHAAAPRAPTRSRRRRVSLRCRR